jgi:hypothetical protein
MLYKEVMVVHCEVSILRGQNEGFIVSDSCMKQPHCADWRQSNCDCVQEVCWQLRHVIVFKKCVYSCDQLPVAGRRYWKKSQCPSLDSSANTHYTSRELECHDVTQEYSQLYEFKSLECNTPIILMKFCVDRIPRSHSRCVPVETIHSS